MKPAHELQPQLEKYELVAVLGHGGMATVYRARDRRLGRNVAVKVIHPHLREDAEIATRFVREARAVAKLHHPNIVEVFDVSEPDDPERYLVVELVDGVSLRKFLLEQKRMPAEIAAALAIEIAEGLEHAHQNSVIHRDIKPENVLIASPGTPSINPMSGGAVARGRIKLTDFGIAKILDAQGVTVTGQVLGSPSHMAPEQIEGNDVTVRADVFGLGVLIYECMTGRLPFEGQNPAQVLRKVIEGRFIPTERLLPTCGAELGRIVDRALAHEPGDRFGSAAELADALRAELARLGFEQPYVELNTYLDSPEQYNESFSDKIVPRLLTAAAAARADRQVIEAASLLNRALAYKPHDPELIAAVARMGKAQVRSRQLRRGARWVGSLLAAALGAWIVASLPRARHAEKHAVAPPSQGALTTSAFAVPRESPPRNAEASSAPPADDAPPVSKPVAPLRSSPVRVVPNSKRAMTRSVQAVISGASGGRLRIDGKEVSWLGVRHELTTGPHQFEVIPPSESCCVPAAPSTIEVVPGEGDQRIVLAIDFRAATLNALSPAGGTVICGELFPGSLVIPGRKSIRVARSETRAKCTVLPAAGGAGLPKTVDVVLRPGDTFTVAN